MHLFFWLVFGHVLGDFSLQNDFLAKGKNHKNPIPGFSWVLILFSHAMIHAGIVALITGNIFLGVLELVLHIATDFLKSNGNIDFRTDQIIHYLCKLLYVILIYLAVV